MEERDVQNGMRRVETLVRDIETWPDAEMRATALELVQSLMDFHGAGLARMTDIVAGAGETGRSVFADFARDGLVGGLLLLYGLHPVEMEARVAGALEKVQIYLRSHGASVELLGMDDGVVRLKVQGSGKSCGASSMSALRLSVEEAIYEAAPDVTAIEVQEVAAPQPVPSVFVQIGRKASYG